MNRLHLCVVVSIVLTLPTPLLADPPTLTDGERIVLVGNTLIEREQRYGYWETLMVALHPAKSLMVRNLGWSGDNVFGLARASFGSPKEGLDKLNGQVRDAKPSVLIVGYGGNEAFAGKPGLPNFVQGVNALLDKASASKPRVVLLGTLRQENLGPPLPDPTVQNERLRMYNDALRQIANQRDATFLDTFNILGDGAPANPVTYNGIHMSAYGYWASGLALMQELGWQPEPWRVEIAANGTVTKATGCKAVPTRGGRKWTLADATLPAPPPPTDSPRPTPAGWQRIFRVNGLATGTYALSIDDVRVKTATAEQWAKGVTLKSGPQFERVEKLREAIVAKNRLFFYRWRPQNETYLFGFRKHEQGQYAKEIPQFDPLIAKKEKEIAKLRQPGTHVYALTKVK